MESKQGFKKLLLDAKNAITNKDFHAAVQKCEDILSKDDNNYNALVFLGVALQELSNKDGALASFKKAAKIEPNQILAWKGLQKYYENEKSTECTKSLQDVYLKLLELIPDKKNCTEIWKKLGLSYFEENDFVHAENCFTKGIDLEDPLSSSAAGNELWILLVSSFLSQKNLSASQLKSLQIGLDKIYQGKLNQIAEFEKWNCETLEKCLKFFHDDLQPTLLLETLKKFDTHNTGGFFKWKLRAYITSFIMNCPSPQRHEIEELLPHLVVSGKDGEALVFFVKGIHSYQDDDCISARDLIKKGLSLSPLCCWESWLLICWVYLRFRDGSSVEHFATEGLKLALKLLPEHRHDYAQKMFFISLGKGYFYQDNVLSLEKAVNVFLKITESEVECLYYTGLTCLILKRMEPFLQILNTLEKESKTLYLGLMGFYCINQKKYMDGKKYLSLALESSYKQLWDEWYIELGKICLLETNSDLATNYFRKASEANAFNFKPYVFLGNYYKSVNDLNQAQICFRNAYSLKKYDEEIGILLSDIYFAANNEEENFVLLEEVTKHSAVGRCKWAWLRLGLIHLRRGTYLSAIRALQAALTAAPNDKVCWECLGEAYMKHGSYTSAVKAFNKTLEFDPDMLYSAYQKANIQLTLGLHKEAANLFKNLLTSVPEYVPALKGLSEAYIALARQYLKQCEPLQMLSLCQMAIESLTRALNENPLLICLWKLMGDVCTVVGPVPAEMVSLTVSNTLLKGIPRSSSDTTILKKDQILQFGVRCYSLSCGKSLRHFHAYYDIAINYYYQSLDINNLSRKVEMLTKAIDAARQAVKLNKTNHSYWILLGVLVGLSEIGNYKLAQHCFIKATTIAPKDPIAWTNLGIFYLSHNNIKLAHQSFKISQSLEPSYPNAWIGQAVCAEIIDHDETADLFRHCSTLSSHVASCIGYGTWVCNILLGTVYYNHEYNYHIKEMSAVPAAVDCVTKYTNIITNVPCAYNIFGLLLERQGLLFSAIAAFKRSVLLSSPKSGCDDLLDDKINCNLSRVLRKVHSYNESIECALAIREHDFGSLCGLAFAYYLNGQLQESSLIYEKAFDMAHSDVNKAHLLVALASVAFEVQGPEEARSLLFKSCEVKPDCPQALYALCALSCLENDMDILTASLEELLLWERNEKEMEHIAYLQNYNSILQGDVTTGQRFLSKVVHKWPGNFNFWKLLSKFLLRSQAPHLAVHCATASSKLCTSPVSEILRLLFVSCRAAGYVTESTSIAKKLVHYYPGEELNWKIITDLVNANHS
ncbi:Tetratricopeptide repeat protein 37 [Chamberlinius hualienensis]